MADRADVEEVIYRAAFVTIRFGEAASIPQSENDISWCLDPLTPLEPDERTRLGDAIRALTEDPTAHRACFIATMTALID